MEALFGLLYRQPSRLVDRETMSRMARLLDAPDAQIGIDGNFALGIARRVIDRTKQAPGIVCSDDVWVALTGEIENRDILLDHVVRGGLDSGDGTDAELLLALYRERGAECAKLLHGYFNCVLWDRGARRVSLLTDRCGGVKAVYHSINRDFLAFGSAARAVVGHPGITRELDLQSLEDVLTLGHPVSPRTMFRNVFVLAAGTTAESCGTNVRVKRYWRRQTYVRTRENLEELGQCYFAALQRAVERCANTNSSVGIMLSGGVDSAALVSLLRRSGVPRIKTFSVHIGDTKLSDRHASQRIAQLYATEHRSLDDMDARCIDLLPEMIWHSESPVQNIHPTYWLARRMCEECDVVVAGYGNDLIWGCWTPHWRAGRLARALLPAFNEVHFLRIRRKLGRRSLRRVYPEAAATDLSLVQRLAFFRGQERDALAAFVGLDESVFGDQLVFREVGKSIVDAHGLWPRLPYTDADVMRLAEKVPPSARLRPIGPGQTEFKSFFKDVMHDREVLPEDVIFRPKSWMYSPTAQWLRRDWHDVLVGTLLGKRASARKLFDRTHVTALLGEHAAGRADHTFSLGMLLAIEIWHRLFIDPPRLAKPDRTLTQVAAEMEA